MANLVSVLQEVTAGAWVALGLAVAVSYWRSRRTDRSMAWLAAAIILLAVVAGANFLPSGIARNWFSQLTLVCFVGAGYSLFRFRVSLIALRQWVHVAVGAVLVCTLVGFWVVQARVNAGQMTSGWLVAVTIGLVVVWAILVMEPAVRFWQMSHQASAVLRGRLKTLALGFGLLVGILGIAIATTTLSSEPSFQVGIQLLELALVPLLYISFTPPSWLRRQWRAGEEQELRLFMQDLLLHEADSRELTDKALVWAARLVGGNAAALFDAQGECVAAYNLQEGQIYALSTHMSSLSSSEQATKSKGREILLVLPISIIGRGQGHLVVAAGAFTPSFGEEERSRTQQFVTAVVAALSLFDLKEAARIDPLTQLSSREHTLATITNALNGKGMFCVAIMDLDFFKNINDTYGHQTGDDTLVAIGQRVMGAVRHDDLVGRLSGEEFVVVFPQAELALAKIISGRILSTIAGTVIATKKAPVQLTASLGLTERRVDDSLDSILTRADRALYTAKNEGRNRLVAA